MSAISETTAKLAYSIKEACSATSLGRTTIYDCINSGQIKTVRIGGRTLIPAQSLQAFVSGEVA